MGLLDVRIAFQLGGRHQARKVVSSQASYDSFSWLYSALYRTRCEIMTIGVDLSDSSVCTCVRVEAAAVEEDKCRQLNYRLDPLNV